MPFLFSPHLSGLRDSICIHMLVVKTACMLCIDFDHLFLIRSSSLEAGLLANFWRYFHSVNYFPHISVGNSASRRKDMLVLKVKIKLISSGISCVDGTLPWEHQRSNLRALLPSVHFWSDVKYRQQLLVKGEDSSVEIVGKTLRSADWEDAPSTLLLFTYTSADLLVEITDPWARKWTCIVSSICGTDHRLLGDRTCCSGFMQ